MQHIRVDAALGLFDNPFPGECDVAVCVFDSVVKRVGLFSLSPFLPFDVCRVCSGISWFIAGVTNCVFSFFQSC